MSTAALLGTRMKRKEDPRLIQGRGHYVDDIKLDGMLHMGFVRSVHPHARIKSVDAAAARAMPGVIGVFTGAGLKGKLGQVPCAAGIEGLKVPGHPCLAVDKVSHVGEPIAAVVATSPYTVRDAVHKVEVDYESLAAVVDPLKAVEKDSPLVHEQFGDNVAFVAKLEGGDWKAVEGEATLKPIKQRFINQRLAPVAIETRGVVA